MKYDLYLALGDSLSIDAYAGPDLGAASLFFSNDDQLYPEFRGSDLSSRNPNCRFLNLAKDGGTIASTLSAIEGLEANDSNVLVTLTVGGNDLLAGLSDQMNFPDPWLAKFEQSFGSLLALTSEKFPQSRVLVGNVYDVIDGTGIAQSRRWEALEFLPALDALNEVIRRQVEAIGGGVLIDINQHFLGHTVRFDDSTYEHYDATDPSCWICLDIEPNARGSSEIRRLFCEAVCVG